MSPPALRPVVRHDTAGRIEPARAGVRFAAGDDAADPAAAAALAEAALVPGAQRVGPLLLRLAIDAGGDRAVYAISVENASGAPLRLESVVLGFRWRGADTRALRFLQHGWQSWSFTGARALDDAGEPAFASGAWLRGMHHAVGAPPPDRAGWHESHLVSVAAAPAGDGPACATGALKTGRGFGIVYLRRDGDAVRVEVEVRVDALLAPDERRDVESVQVALGTRPPELLERFAAALGRAAGARTASRFIAGWCSWYHFFHRVTEDDLRRNLDALAARRDALPVELVQLDDGYQRAVGDWLETNDKFPSGLEALAGEIRAAGFTPGLWTAPWLVAPESRLFDAHPEWLLRDGNHFLRGLHHRVWSEAGFIHVLDPTREDVVAHLRALFATLSAWGFAYQKLDFLYAVAMRADARDPGVAPAARLRRALEAVRAGAGDDAYLLGCGCPLGPAVGLVDGMRIGPDVAPHWQADPAALVPGLEAALPSTRSAVRSVLARAFLHRRLFSNDPDCLMARSSDTKLTRDEARTLAAATAAASGLVVFSDDVATLDDAGLALVRETIELAREVDVPGEPGATRALGLLDDEHAAGALARTRSGALLVLVNAGDAGRRAELDLESAGAGALRVGDALLGSAPPVRRGATRVAAELAPHSSAVYRLRRGPPLAVFCDYDGTFAVQDVGASFARRYAGDRRRAFWSRFERGEITAWEYNLEILDGLRVPRAEYEAFLKSVELDPGARALVRFCEERAIPFRVLSDGFDYNLERLMEIHGIRFAYDANRMRYERDVWRIEAAYPDAACACGTGVCKRGRIEAYRREHPEVRIVHIGNGRVSDLCGAEAADLVFAKDQLAIALRERAVPFEPFETLLDVVAALERSTGGCA